MNLYFWYISLNPHFIPLVKAIAKHASVENVTLLIPAKVEENRKIFKWDNEIEVSNKLRIEVAPNSETIRDMYSIDDSEQYHFYAGIRGFRFVYQAFLESLRCKNIKRGIITEPPFLYKKPILFHYVRYFLQDFKYRNYIQYYFTIGSLAYKYYNNIYPKWKIIPFWYVTSLPDEYTIPRSSSVVKLVYVGALIDRKNVIALVKAASMFSKVDLQLDIIGTGTLCTSVENLISEQQIDNVNLLGAFTLDETRKRINQYDALILPSKHDGWGATINEALMRGVYVMSSSKCGASYLVTDENKGCVFCPSIKGIGEAISYLIDNVDKIRSSIEYRIKTSQTISPAMSAEYFISKL